MVVVAPRENVYAAGTIGDSMVVVDPDFARCPARPAGTRFSEGLGMWLVDRHEDVRAVLADRAGFGPENALTAVVPLGMGALRELAAVRFALPPTLASNGGPSHRAFRAFTSRWFSVRRVQDARPGVEELASARAAEAARRLASDGVCDLVPVVCRPVAATVLLDTLGLGDVDLDALHRWSADSLELFWGRPDPVRQRALARSAAGFHARLRERVRDARAAGPEAGGEPDFVAELTRLHVDGRPVTDDEAISVCYFLLIAGQATTAHLAAAALRLLLTDRDAWKAVVADPGTAAEAAVEETLRLAPSVTTWRRVAYEDRRVGDRQVRAGDSVLLMLADAGRDPEVYDEPERVRLDRPGARGHLAFGAGAHRCLGAELARMEAAAIVRAVARDLPGIRLDDAEPGMLDLLSFRAPEHVRVLPE